MGRQVRIKICGITSKEDAFQAAHCGAWALGFIFYKKSPRYISPGKAGKIIKELPPFVTPVGVFVNEEEKILREICESARVQTIQLHGDESPGFCQRVKDYKIIKAFRAGPRFDFSKLLAYQVENYLFDAFQEGAYGGTGKTFAWKILQRQKFTRPFILSGGLNANNIQEALAAVDPFAVDVSSGVEKAPGVKDYKLLRQFFEALFVIGKS